jgi:hypothetical protein
MKIRTRIVFWIIVILLCIFEWQYLTGGEQPKPLTVSQRLAKLEQRQETLKAITCGQCHINRVEWEGSRHEGER